MQFPSITDHVLQGTLADPADTPTFSRSVLDLGERERHAEAYRLHQDLMLLRKQTVAFRAERPGTVDGAVLSNHAFLLRFFTDDHLDDRLLIVNLGRDLSRASFAEPLLAPPSPALDWTVCWSSEDPAYGGSGTTPVWTKDYADRAVPDVAASGRYLFAAESAVVLAPCPRKDPPEPGLRRRTA
jgi:maltooligosyltrehalose trehalohydrolase